MDLVELIQEKRFLGREFFTWLWYKSEERGGTIYLPGEGDIQLVFEKHMLLEHGEGEANESLICRGLETELQEARTGLMVGKKIEQARLRLTRGSNEWSFTIRAGLLDFANLRPPKTMTASEEADDPAGAEGRILEKISMVEEVVRTVNELFRMFLKSRLSPTWETEELAKVRDWVKKGAWPAA